MEEQPVAVADMTCLRYGMAAVAGVHSAIVVGVAFVLHQHVAEDIHDRVQGGEYYF